MSGGPPTGNEPVYGQDPQHAQMDMGGADPTMEDILASIRKILNEDETPPAPPAEPEAAPFMLTESMLVEAPAPIQAPIPAPTPIPAPAPVHFQIPADATYLMPVQAQPDIPAPFPQPEPSFLEPAPIVSSDHTPYPAPPYPAPQAMHMDDLVAPAAAAAAAASLGTLVRAVAAERHSVVNRGGPSIEDVVREELRPLLKSWLDDHLPPLVERLVKAEIERVISRSLG